MPEWDIEVRFGRFLRTCEGVPAYKNAIDIADSALPILRLRRRGATWRASPLINGKSFLTRRRYLTPRAAVKDTRAAPVEDEQYIQRAKKKCDRSPPFLPRGVWSAMFRTAIQTSNDTGAQVYLRTEHRLGMYIA